MCKYTNILVSNEHGTLWPPMSLGLCVHVYTVIYNTHCLQVYIHIYNDHENINSKVV